MQITVPIPGSNPTPSVKVAEVEKHRIKCPLCPLGFGEFEVIKTNGQIQVKNINDPVKCNACGRNFKIRPRLQFIGVPIESE